MAEPNEALVLRIGAFDVLHRFPLMRWDLNQHKESTDDWAAAFREAVRVRTDRLKHKVFIGLSHGYDSGAIALALKQLKVPFLAFTVRGNENMEVIGARKAMLKPLAKSTMITLSGKALDEEKAFMQRRCEPYRYGIPGYTTVALDSASSGLSAILRRATPKGGLVYLSGSGGDEIISDYTLHGPQNTRVPLPRFSCFGGVWPANLSAPGADGKPFFPWCSFYKHTQRAFLMKEELTAGVHGAEGRYPFLDPKVVQEYLWLKHTVKNAEYKKPVADMLRAAHFPNDWGTKMGFGLGGEKAFSVFSSFWPQVWFSGALIFALVCMFACGVNPTSYSSSMRR